MQALTVELMEVIDEMLLLMFMDWQYQQEIFIITVQRLVEEFEGIELVVVKVDENDEMVLIEDRY